MGWYFFSPCIADAGIAQWAVVFSVTAHKKAISALAVYDDLIVTGASDSLVKIWRVNTSSDKGMFVLMHVS